MPIMGINDNVVALVKMWRGVERLSLRYLPDVCTSPECNVSDVPKARLYARDAVGGRAVIEFLVRLIAAKVACIMPRYPMQQFC